MKRSKFVAKVKAAFRRNPKPHKVDEIDKSEADSQDSGMCPGIVDSSAATAVNIPIVKITKADDTKADDTKHDGGNISLSNDLMADPLVPTHKRLARRLIERLSALNHTLGNHIKRATRPKPKPKPRRWSLARNGNTADRSSNLTILDFMTDREQEARRQADEQHRINRKKMYATSQAALRRAQAGRPNRIYIRDIIRHHPFQNVSQTVIIEEVENEDPLSLVDMLEEEAGLLMGEGAGAVASSGLPAGRASSIAATFGSDSTVPGGSFAPGTLPPGVHPAGIPAGVPYGHHNAVAIPRNVAPARYYISDISDISVLPPTSIDVDSDVHSTRSADLIGQTDEDARLEYISNEVERWSV